MAQPRPQVEQSAPRPKKDVEKIDLTEVGPETSRGIQRGKAHKRRIGRESQIARAEAARREIDTPPPPTIEDGKEEAYVLAKARKLEPWAMRELEHQLLHSRDSRERRSAADKIIDMNGHGRRENGQLGNGPVIVVMGMQPGVPLHLQGTGTVEGKVVSKDAPSSQDSD